MHQIQPAIFIKPVSAPTPIHAIQIPPPTLMQRAQRAIPWLAAAWALGVIVLSIRHLGGWLLLRKLRRANHPLSDDPWPQVLARLVARLKIQRRVQLARSALVDAPSVIGWLKPLILVPASAIAGLSPQELEGILAHELAHVRRNDYLVNLLQTLIETLLFYHPAVWWIGHVIRRERENCCDDLAAQVCGDARVYAGALARLEELRGVPTQLALSSGGAALLPRIRRLLNAPAPKTRRRSWSFTAAAILLACVAAPIVTIQLSARAQDANKREPATHPSTLPASSINKDDLVAEVSDYRISPGDLLSVSITDLVGPNVETVKTCRVTEKGAISMPLIGSIQAAGNTEAELEKTIMNAYRDAKLIQMAQVSVSITEPRGRSISIIGGVSKPGQYQLARSDARLIDVLAQAGGTANASGDAIILRAGEKGGEPRKLQIPLQKLLAGDASVNVVIKPKDQIIVPPGKFNVAANVPEEDPAVRAQLDKKLPELRFEAVAFSDVIDFLRDVTGANIFVDWNALKGAGVDSSAAVTVRVRDVSFRKALELVLQSAGADLTFEVDQNVIKISTKQSLQSAAGEDPFALAPAGALTFAAPSAATALPDLGIRATDTPEQRLKKLQSAYQRIGDDIKKANEEFELAALNYGRESAQAIQLAQRCKALGTRALDLRSAIDQTKMAITAANAEHAPATQPSVRSNTTHPSN
jgi:protein involved in polysaccharide export with SLBB domain